MSVDAKSYLIILSPRSGFRDVYLLTIVSAWAASKSLNSWYYEVLKTFKIRSLYFEVRNFLKNWAEFCYIGNWCNEISGHRWNKQSENFLLYFGWQKTTKNHANTSMSLYSSASRIWQIAYSYLIVIALPPFKHCLCRRAKCTTYLYQIQPKLTQFLDILDTRNEWKATLHSAVGDGWKWY